LGQFFFVLLYETFWKLAVLASSGEQPYLLGPLEKANLNPRISPLLLVERAQTVLYRAFHEKRKHMNPTHRTMPLAVFNP
jgi:hypothetical protein